MLATPSVTQVTFSDGFAQVVVSPVLTTIVAADRGETTICCVLSVAQRCTLGVRLGVHEVGAIVVVVGACVVVGPTVVDGMGVVASYAT